MPIDTWKPTAETYLQALKDQNPWQKINKVPASLAMSVRRPLADELWRVLMKTPTRYHLILGPRRVGKTVAIYQTIDRLIADGIDPMRLWFLRLDHPLLTHYSLGGWATSLRRMYSPTPEAPLFLFLDEINYSPSWDKWLKTFYDEQWPVRVVATSSSTAALRGKTIESGIGRWSEQHLAPYSFFEFLMLKSRLPEERLVEEDFFDTLSRIIEDKPNYDAGVEPHKKLSVGLKLFTVIGGFPELLYSLGDDEDMDGALLRSQQVLRSEAVQRVTGMDIPQAYDIKHPRLLEKLLYILAGQMCGQMNVSQLAGMLELSRQTTHDYIHYLEQAYLIFNIPNYAKSEEAVQRRKPKLYFVDGAVRNAALQRGLGPIQDSTEMGHLIENCVASHLQALALQTQGRVFFWRQGDKEVDLIYTLGGYQPIAFEVALKPGHHLKGLRALQDRHSETRGRCFVITSESNQFTLPKDDPDGVGRIPLLPFLMAIGSQTHYSLRHRLGVA